MPQPHRDTEISLSSSTHHPSLNQFPIPLPSVNCHSILNQKLIPRDFLGSRTKLPHDTGRPYRSEISDPELVDISSSQKDRNTEFNKDITGSHLDRNREPGSFAVPIRESGAPVDNGLVVSRTTSPESTKKLPLDLKPKGSLSGFAVPSDVDLLAKPIMPRNSSIDSAISTVSTTSINKAVGELRDPSPNSVRNLIATAGSAENLIAHLLKDKNSVASQNAQLWKLVEKQRALLLGLNKDLERVSKDRDKYRKKLNELEKNTAVNIAASRSPLEPSPAEGRAHNTNDSTLSTKIQPHGLAQQQVSVNTPAISAVSETSHIVHGLNSEEHGNKENTTIAPEFDSAPAETHVEVPEGSGTSLPHSKLQTPTTIPPSFNVIEASPAADKQSKSLASNRKAPPKPLNLLQPATSGLISDESVADTEFGEETTRGRRRTREDDDRDREMSAKKAEAEARSRSKKNQLSKIIVNEENQPFVPPQVASALPAPGLPMSPRPQHAQTFLAPSVHLATGASQPVSLGDRLQTNPLKSPGLPLSPRPMNRPDIAAVSVSLPLSPRANMGAFPLSPRAPKHALPIPTNLAAPTDAAALQNTQSRSHQMSPQAMAPSPIDRLQLHQPIGSDAPPVYRGLAVSAFPNLLLPPNALPSIQVKVHSSRLRPSRHTVLGLKHQEETIVFSLSIISRSSYSELWRVEKAPTALPQLEQQLKPRGIDLPKMPDRRLFTGEAPALLDERRKAVDAYFDELLDIHIDETAAISICKFLSTDVIDPEQKARDSPTPGSEPVMPSASPSGPVTKTGYLTKKGKNFGGWKSRFFILEGTELRYYESAGGPHLGTIRLQHALIGKQKESDMLDDGDGQFRHAFLIQESKRKESGNFIRHILCAESDIERDEWVKALLYWVEGNGASGLAHDHNDVESRYQVSRAGSGSKDTHVNTPTPTSVSSVDSSILDSIPSTKITNSSGPLNGNHVTESSTWSSKSTGMSPLKEIKDKTHKMSNIFGFKKPDPAPVQQDQKPPKPRILRHNGYVRPVFGLPLVEAIEYCAPFNVEVDLPAVVYRSIEYLRYKKAANEEGLFRLSGSNVVVRNLKERFNTEGDVDLVHEDEYHDVHAVASLFKTYLRELPSTLLTREYHIEFIKVLELDGEANKVAAYNTLVHMLPAANFSLLKEMCKYLLEVTQSADKNKMSVRNIGIVFSPTLNIPTPVFTLLLTEYNAIFEQQASEVSSIRTTEIRAPAALTPDDIRSPRHQMFSDLPTPAYHQTTFHGQGPLPPPRATMTGTGEIGFMPLTQIYETSNLGLPSTPQPQHPALTQAADAGGFSSLNGLLAPTNAPTDKARKRQSAIIFSG